MMYKFEHKKLPQLRFLISIFRNLLITRYASTHNNFQIVRISLAKEKSLLKYYGPKVWENIPLQIKNAPSLKVFINFYRNHLIGNYSDYFG